MPLIPLRFTQSRIGKLVPGGHRSLTFSLVNYMQYDGYEQKSKRIDYGTLVRSVKNKLITISLSNRGVPMKKWSDTSFYKHNIKPRIWRIKCCYCLYCSTQQPIPYFWSAIAVIICVIPGKVEVGLGALTPFLLNSLLKNMPLFIIFLLYHVADECNPSP